MAAFQGLAKNSIIVFLNTQTGDWQKAPREVQRALNGAGRYIPKTVVFDPNMKKLASIPYTTIKSKGMKAFEIADKKIKEFYEGESGESGKGEKVPAPSSAPAAGEVEAKPVELPMTKWIDYRGREVMARIEIMHGTEIVFVREDGTKFTCPLDKLSPTSQSIAKRQLRKRDEPPIEEAAVAEPSSDSEGAGEEPKPETESGT
ncbi:MAG: hypothetical protein R3F11_27205 [Verrucomicrobiales bacterium]